MANPRGTYFTVHFNKSGDAIGVETASGKKPPKKNVSTRSPLTMTQVDKLIPAVIVSKKGKSPCCIIINGYYYCWC
jgi:hypothetical protein